MKNRSIWIFLSSLLWASDGPIRTSLVSRVPSLVIVTLEHLFDSLVAIPVIIRGRERIRSLNYKDWLVVFYLGIFASGIALLAFTSSFSYVSPSTSLVIQKLQPIFAIILSAIFLRERFLFKTWVIVAVGFIASYFVTFGFTLPSLSGYGSGLLNFYGGGLAALAALLWGGATVVGRFGLRNMNWQLIAALRFVVGFLFLFLCSAASGVTTSLFSLPGYDYLLIAIAALVSGVVAMFIYYWALAKTSAVVATVAEMGYPVLGVAINWIALGDRGALDLYQIFGAVILLICVFLLRQE